MKRDLLSRIAFAPVLVAGVLLTGVSPASADSSVGANISTSAGGTITSAGLLTGQTGFTVIGGAVSLNASAGTNTVNIGTGTTTGAIAIGGGLNELSIDTTSWDVSSAGVVSGLTGLTSTGNIDLTGANMLGVTPFVLEGATVDGNTTWLTVEDPTGGNEIIFPDWSGKVLLDANSLIPAFDNTAFSDLGSSSFRWRDLYLGGTTHYIDNSPLPGVDWRLFTFSDDFLITEGISGRNALTLIQDSVNTNSFVYSTNGSTVNQYQTVANNSVYTVETNNGSPAGGIGADGIGIAFENTLRNSAGAGVMVLKTTATLESATGGAESTRVKYETYNDGALQERFSMLDTRLVLGPTIFEMSRGTDAPSAGDLVLVHNGNLFHVTGTTQINAITTTGLQSGTEITLIFDASVTVKHNTAGGAGTALMLLSGAADFAATANDVLKLIYDGTSFYEVSRTVI